MSFIAGYERAKEMYAQRPALVINNICYSYQELDACVKKIGLILHKAGLSSGQVIAVAEEPDLFSYAAIIAVLVSGNVLLPINKEFPTDRNVYILRKVKPAIFLSAQHDTQIERVLHEVPELELGWNHEDLSEKELKTSQKALTYPGIAYILFTSGSTGHPKGVPVSYRNLDACLQFFLKNYDFNEEDRFLQVYNTTFDVFYFSFIVPLLVGGSCYFVHEEKTGLKYLQIFKALQQYEITVVSMVPTLLLFAEKYLEQFTYPSLRYSFFSGDALFHSIATKWKRCFPNGSLHNFYGPTETTIVCTRYVWEEGKSLQESYYDVVPLGLPFQGMEYLLVNDQYETVSKGEIGELAFTGQQVIAGYIDNEHSEKFFRDSVSGRLYYKTGDLAFVNDNNNLVFTGRKDFQHKINGYRIELAEVELAISSIVQQPCYAVVKKNKSGLNVLYGIILKQSMTEKQILTVLKHKVPHYMVPSRILQVEQFPLNSNNKVDRLLLMEMIR